MIKSNLNVRDSFHGKSVLITGSTGFIGKVLVEKLLKDCIGIKKIYLLFRGKNALDYTVRFQKYVNSSAFFKVAEKDDKLLHKLVPIKGDLNDTLDLGIFPDDLKLLKKEVNVIFHLAANVNFDETIMSTLKTNTLATQILIDMAKNFEKLDVFVYMSTAFSNTIPEININEIVQNFNYDFNFKNVMEKNSASDINKIDGSAKDMFRNSYLFSKDLSEQIIKRNELELPMIILRPSNVTPSYKDPIPGWIDSTSTLNGMYIGMASGMIRSINVDKDLKVDYVPCDFVANLTIVSAAKMINNPRKDLRVYNCTMAKENLYSIEETIEFYKKEKFFKKYPPSLIIWTPNPTITNNYLIYLFNFIFIQLLYAFIVDVYMILIGKPPFLISAQLKLFKIQKHYESYLSHCNFSQNKFFSLCDELTGEER